MVIGLGTQWREMHLCRVSPGILVSLSVCPICVLFIALLTKVLYSRHLYRFESARFAVFIEVWNAHCVVSKDRNNFAPHTQTLRVQILVRALSLSKHKSPRNNGRNITTNITSLATRYMRDLFLRHMMIVVLSKLLDAQQIS